MLVCVHIPTGTTARKGLNIDHVKGRIVAPTIAQIDIAADIEIGSATP
jgi:hypothetical protein